MRTAATTSLAGNGVMRSTPPEVLHFGTQRVQQVGVRPSLLGGALVISRRSWAKIQG